MTPGYGVVLFDFDHTLYDSDESERLAFAETMSAIGVESAAAAAAFVPYHEINQALWREVEAGTTRPIEVRIRRFERLVAHLGLDADPVMLADAFVAGLAGHGQLFPGARQLLEELAGRVRLGLVTNALSEVQRTRLTRLGIADLFEATIISAEVGVSKPAAGIFDIALDELGCSERDRVLMIGDSLASDIRGGINAGLATCWYNPRGAPGDPAIVPTHVVAQLCELPGIIVG